MDIARHPHVLLFGALSLTTAIALGAYGVHRMRSPLVLDAPPPQVFADSPDVNPQIPPSIIEAVVQYRLQTAIDSLEAAIPREYGDLEQRLPVTGSKRMSYGFAVRRSPFVATLAGQSLTLSSVVEYSAHIWYRPPFGPELSAGCGTGDDPRPRVRVTLISTPQLTRDWQLRTKTRVLRLEPFSDQARDRCRVTVLRLDATDRVIEATRGMLIRRMQLFDHNTARWPTRERFERLWMQLQRRVRLTQGVYLEVNPYGAQWSELSIRGDTVVTRLRLVASPRIVTNAVRELQRPLPALRPGGAASAGPAGASAHIAVEGTFSYPVASALLRRALVGRTVVQSGRKVRIQDVKLSGLGGGRLALALTLSGGIRGRLFFTGTPRLDVTSGQMSIPDLDFDIGTEQLLVQGFAWLNGVDIRDFLRARARLPDSEALGKLRGLAQHGINRLLAPGVVLSGNIHSARGTSVRATVEDIRLRAMADAEFRLDIDRGPRIPRQGGGGRPARQQRRNSRPVPGR